MSWRDRSACSRYEPQWWEITGKHLTQENRAAIRICASCPVTSECIDDALVHHDEGVIRAGQALRDQRAHRKKVPA